MNDSPSPAVPFPADDPKRLRSELRRAMEDLIGWVGFAPFLVTPGNWRAWHVQAHHSAANILARDPDVLPRQTDWHTQTFAKLFHAMSPGSGHWLSFISFGLFFTAQGQAFLWHHCRQPAFQHVHLHRARERVLTVLLAVGWGALGWVLGPRAALYALVLPLLIGNVSLMIYIATNHWMQPASEETDNPFVNTASVETHPVLNWLHFNFSYHQEHHIFPAQSPKYAPLLRKHLRALNPRASIVYPHRHASADAVPAPGALLAGWTDPAGPGRHPGDEHPRAAPAVGSPGAVSPR